MAEVQSLNGTLATIASWKLWAGLIALISLPVLVPGLLEDRAKAVAERCALDAVKLQLKDPYSAVFEDVTVSAAGAGYSVSGHVNARNGFGAYTGRQSFSGLMQDCQGQVTLMPAI